MLNQVVIVGRIYSIENGTLIMAVPRSYKNEQGEYETDYIDVKLLGSIEQNVSAYCEKGDLVGIKGRLQGGLNTMSVIAEKVTFLSNKKIDDREDISE
jgi:single-strand DNA-binding protein